MATKLVTLRMDENLKEEFDSFCDEVGITTTSAFTMFAKAALRERRIPFEIVADPFYSASNQEALRQSMHELENGEFAQVSSADFDSLLESL